MLSEKIVNFGRLSSNITIIRLSNNSYLRFANFSLIIKNKKIDNMIFRIIVFFSIILYNYKNILNINIIFDSILKNPILLSLVLFLYFF